MSAEWVTLKELERQEQVAHSMRTIQNEITRLEAFGLTLSLDCDDGFIVAEYGPDEAGDYGAPGLIAKVRKVAR